jgi:UDP-glucose 4-epimerase
VLGDAVTEDVLHDVVADVEHVVWAAGGLMPAESNERPVDDVVATLPPFLRLLDALVGRGSSASVSLLSSGGTVYGDPTVLPVPEHHLPQPLSSHGVSKVACEMYLSMYRELYGLDTVALRCANVYGEGQVPYRSQGVVATALECARTQESIPLVDDGLAVRDFIYVDDLVDVVCTLAARKDRPTTVNVGSGVGTSVRELLALLEQVTGRRITTHPVPSRPGDVRTVVLDITLLRSLMAFEPVPLEEGLARLWRETEGAQQLAQP